MGKIFIKLIKNKLKNQGDKSIPILPTRTLTEACPDACDFLTRPGECQKFPFAMRYP
jgi:hypothetical protein